MRHVNEKYNIKYDHNKIVKSLDTLEDAIKFINDGMENKDSESFVLLDGDKEMIWLDSYRDENDNGLGYTVSRQDDKKSIEYIKDKGLVIKEQEPENDEMLHDVVVKEAGRMKYYSAAQKLAKMRFIKDTSKPSYIDFEANCVHHNTNEQLNATIESLVKQLKATNESLEEAVENWYKQEW